LGFGFIIAFMVEKVECSNQEGGEMTRVRITERGFPQNCPLPYSLAEEVLANTNRNTRRACGVCMDMADKTRVYREKYPWWLSMTEKFLGK